MAPLKLHVRTEYVTPFRGVEFRDDDDGIMTASAALQKAWLLRLKDERITTDALNQGCNQLIRYVAHASDNDLIAIRNPDRENAHTPLRDAIYTMWNRVFSEISNFLVQTNCGTGVFELDPLPHQSLELRFPETGEEGEMVKVAEFSHDKHILVMPAFIEPGINLKTTLEDEGEAFAQANTGLEKPSFTFDATETDWAYLGTDIYWVKANQIISVHVPKKAAKVGKLASVLVCGKYARNFAHCNNEEHMRLHKLYDDGYDEKPGSSWCGMGPVGDRRTEDDQCAEIQNLAVRLENEAITKVDSVKSA